MRAVSDYQMELKAWAQSALPDSAKPHPPICPSLLDLYLTCKDWGALPYAGGVMDQPYLLWHYINAAGAAYNERVTEYRRLQEFLERQKREQERTKHETGY